MKRILTWMSICLVLLALAGCGGGGNDTSTAPKPTVRFFNGVCDTPDYDWFLNDDLMAAAQTFLGSTPDFEELASGTKDVLLNEAGTTNTTWSEVFEFERDKHYLICALGKHSFGAEPLKRARIFRFEIDRRLPVGNKARVFVIHGFNREVGAETPNLDVQNPGNNPINKFSDVPYGGVAQKEIDAVSQTFEARRAGTEFAYVTTTFTFLPGKVYAMFILGLEDGVGLEAPRIEIVELSID